jgi:hypothetical protein
MGAKLERLDRANRWLDEVACLPPGHPDRLRYLTFAEQILEGPAPVRQRPAPEAPPNPSRAGRK